MSKDGRLISELAAPSPDGTHLLRLSANTRTLDSQGKVVDLIQIRDASQVPALPGSTVLVGRAYDFTPSGATFDGRLDVTLGYDVNALPKRPTSIWLGVFRTSSGWQQLDTNQNTVASVGRLTASVPHFSVFAVLAGVPPASFRSANLDVTRSQHSYWPGFPFLKIFGREVRVTADATNQGGQAGSNVVTVTIDGRSRGEQTVTLEVDQSQRVTFDIDHVSFGRHTVKVGDLSGQFVTSITINWWVAIGSILLAGALVALLVMMVVIPFVRRPRLHPPKGTKAAS